VARGRKKATAASGRLTVHHHHTQSLVDPHARARADELLEYVALHGGKLYLTGRHYAELTRRGIPPHATDAAKALLYAEGAVDIRLAGRTPVLVITESPGHFEWRRRR
jgi:hypothetical protein